MIRSKNINPLETKELIDNIFITKDKTLYLITKDKTDYKQSFSNNEFFITTNESNTVLYKDLDNSLMKEIIIYKEQTSLKDKWKQITKITKLLNTNIAKFNNESIDFSTYIESITNVESEKDDIVNLLIDFHTKSENICIYDYGLEHFKFKIYMKAIYYNKGNSILVFTPKKLSKDVIVFNYELYYLHNQVPLNFDMKDKIKEIFYNLPENIISDFKKEYNLKESFRFKLNNSFLNKKNSIKKYRFMKIKKTF